MIPKKIRFVSPGSHCSCFVDMYRPIGEDDDNPADPGRLGMIGKREKGGVRRTHALFEQANKPSLFPEAMSHVPWTGSI